MKNDAKALIYRGRVFDLVRCLRRLPDGRMTDVEVIEHPGAALIVPFLDRDRVILLRQFRPAVDTWLYEFPAGTREGRESLLDCARREIQEETGYAASRISLLGRIYPVPGYATERISIYKAEGLKVSPRAKDRDEVFDSKIFTRRQMRELWRRGKILDAKTICALAFCGWF
ncbi:ADP-ribose pyrophosphatase [Candidatus Velamenicoccus archaeovorus]|uniref:GDP-mannose pyrophosphatase n=1 Tax=Velamenicoccus archaeovorus TaxID=1930593 RepID=A0A410P637_VELA1|nr:NUDIX hydrolase [Candidatus Velamenicoccus archaeovorus]QAT17528.1 ADP-ribose pyrophosphatase [Candidatus Velamenicoccus archaeovorus]